MYCIFLQPAVTNVSFSVTPEYLCNSLDNSTIDLNISCSLTLFASLTPVQWANAVNGSSPYVVLYVALNDTVVYLWNYAPTVLTLLSGVLVTPSPSALSPNASLAVNNTPAPGTCDHEVCFN